MRPARVWVFLLTFSLPLLAAGPGLALTLDEARHLLARTGFGPSRADVEALAGLSRAEAVERLLSQARETPVTSLPDWYAGWKPPQRRSLDQAARQALRKQTIDQAVELKTWWMAEMLASPAPLTEVMTLFWHNHFTSGLRKVKAPALLLRQNLLLRRHALDNFGDLLRAVARDPAMLLYLDNARSRARAPNENFARELLELFTLGEGHYGEQDIKQVARAFTGWSLERETGEFVFRAAWHDRGPKKILDRVGNFDGEDVIGILLAHPRTASLIVEKLWRAFVSERPDPDEVARLAALFRTGGYEMRPLLRALFTSEAFWAADIRGRLIKSPVELIVGTLRLFEIEAGEGPRLMLLSRRLGQDLFEPPNVKGWPGGTAWITSDTLLLRQEILSRLTGAWGGKGDRAARRKDDKASKKDRKSERRAGAMARYLGRRLEAWIAGLEGPWQSAEAVTALTLALPPVDNTVLDRAPSGALLRQLLLDPVYQLK